MKLFGVSLGKQKPVPFLQFRDFVRLAVRKNAPGAKIEPTDAGFILRLEGHNPITCNLRNLYNAYCKNTGERDVLIRQWMDSLITEVPEQPWSEARIILRPTLKNADYVTRANQSLAKQNPPDSLPAQLFIGELMVILMREYGGALAGVTQHQLDQWGVTLEEAMHVALNNVGMLSFPHIANSLLSGSALGKKDAALQQEVGLVFEDNHLTATWLISERFRDYVAQRLEGDYVVTVPNRNKLIAIRADEPGVIGSIIQANRSVQNQPYFLTGQCYHVDAATTGGQVTIYTLKGLSQALDPNSLFAAGNQDKTPSLAQEVQKAGTGSLARDLNSYYNLTEPTEEVAFVEEPAKGKTGKIGLR